MWVLAITLSVWPERFLVNWTPNPDLEGVVIVITSDTNGQNYFSYDFYPILDEGQFSMDIQRHVKLPPHNSYTIQAETMKWDAAGRNYEIVDWTSTTIHVP